MEKMITLLVVDDEAEIRSGFRSILPWQDYGIELVGTASNGVEALKMIRYYEPDIVITDIQMPGMNGLELLKRVNQEQFDCLFVILSGYDDFQYARTAIKEGVYDYILKPVVVDELIALVYQLSAEVTKKRTQHINEVRLTKNLHSANKIIKQQHFISELLREELNSAQIEGILQKESFNLHSGQSAAVILHIYEKTQTVQLADEEMGDGSIPTTLHFLEQYYQNIPAIFCHMNKSAIVIFHNTTSRESLYQETDQLISDLYTTCNIRAFGAIGPLTDSLKDVHQSYRIANQVVSWHIFPEMGYIADDCVLTSLGPQNLIKDNQIILDIQACDQEQLKRDFEAYTRNLFFTPYPPPAYLFSMYNFLIMDIRSQLSENGLQSYTGDAYQAMRQFDTFAEVKGWVLNILIEYGNELSVLNAKSQDPLILKAVDYITNHIFNKVSAEDVCQHVGYSQSYFSKYFRQQTQLNLRDYILDLKITYAQEQLKKNAQTPKELAIMLGYEEYSSFSRAFKTRTGFSPLDYQKSFY